MSKLLAVIRVKGTIKVPKEKAETLRRLRLTARNTMVIYYDTPSLRGMLAKAGRYVAWGELENKELLVNLLKKRGRTIGAHKLDGEFLKSVGCQDLEELASHIFEGELNNYKKKGLLNRFSLTPPSRGLVETSSGVKWGYYGTDISTLINRMM